METTNQLKKIAIVGPECTGKSAIASYLAKYYQTIWIPEYAREYCAKLTKACTLEDELNIFYGQRALEDLLIQKGQKMVFCDTTFLTVKIWCDYVFKQTPIQVLDALKKHHQYDFFLLMDIDLPWENDPLRDFPNDKQRQYFFEIWQKELQYLKAPFTIISGIGQERFNQAITAIENLHLS